MFYSPFEFSDANDVTNLVEAISRGAALVKTRVEEAQRYAEEVRAIKSSSVGTAREIESLRSDLLKNVADLRKELEWKSDKPPNIFADPRTAANERIGG